MLAQPRRSCCAGLRVCPLFTDETRPLQQIPALQQRAPNREVQHLHASLRRSASTTRAGVIPRSHATTFSVCGTGAIPQARPQRVVRQPRVDLRQPLQRRPRRPLADRQVLVVGLVPPLVRGMADAHAQPHADQGRRSPPPRLLPADTPGGSRRTTAAMAASGSGLSSSAYAAAIATSAATTL